MFGQTWNFSRKIVVGTIIGFFGAACGSIGGVGESCIFVPMLTLIIGFDAKSSTALSKCMITGTAIATFFYNVRQRHPTLELPVIDYDLEFLIQPMLIFGISIGVAFNVIFPDWLITILLITLFTGSELYGTRLTAAVLIGLLVVSISVLAEPSLKQEAKYQNANKKVESNHVTEGPASKSRSGYKHVWPDMKFGWKIVVGSIMGFFGSACGSAAGVGGGGIYTLLLNLIIGFDPKSSIALSKCMITGAAIATVFYNLKQRHPTLEQPVIDYDLALLFQPTLVLGISIGVSLNVIFAEWMITMLIIILYSAMAFKTFLRGVATWKKETAAKSEAAKVRKDLDSNGNRGRVEETTKPKRSEVSIYENIYWKELGLLVTVWIIILALQIAKSYYTATCSKLYWVLDVLQLPVAGGVSAYEAIGLYKGWRKIASKGEVVTKLTVKQLVLYWFCGVIAGLIGGLLGIGGGIILSPLFLELGIPPQVSSATSTFAMAFSSSISAVEYYLLKRFPVPYALYFCGVTMLAAFVGQYAVRKLIEIMGRASVIIFILSFTIFVSAVSLGAVGIEKMIEKIHHKEYMGFDDICSYE